MFTEIQGFRSSTKEVPACSVIQGSKLSGFLFTIFTIEIPLIPTLLKEKQYTELLLLVLYDKSHNKKLNKINTYNFFPFMRRVWPVWDLENFHRRSENDV